MSDSETANCRLCADLQPLSNLVDLQKDEEKRQKVTKKLIRLSLTTNLDSSYDALAKTVCFSCIESLDAAFDFVIHVEKAQNRLAEVGIKEELNCSNMYYSFEENYDDRSVKEEPDTSSDLEVTIRTRKKIKVEKYSNVDNKDCLDIPISSWKEYNWLCAYCDTRFPDIDELKEHSMTFHGCCNPYRCSDCNCRKLRLDSFVKHVKKHRQHLKLSCYKCHMTFSRQYDTMKHRKQHLTSEFKCSGCNETFPTLKQSVEHSDLYNRDKKSRDVPVQHLTDDLTCVFCSKKFKHKGGLAQHLLIHTDRKRNHTCEICGKCFLNKPTLAGHMMTHEGTKPHQCEMCTQRFRTLSQLRAHVGIHDGKKPFSCEQCGKLFRLQRQLASHSIIHTDSLPFICTYCDKGFRFKTILTQHMRQHTGLKPYECQMCQREFTNWPNYNKHMKRRHDINMAKRKQTPGGLLPINPTTGEVDKLPETNKTVEWKKKIIDNKHPGRPKRKKIDT